MTKDSEKQPAVIKKLRRKFIAINLAMAVLVLACAFGIVSYLDYTTRVDNVYSELRYVLTEAATPEVVQLNSTQPLNRERQGLVDINNISTDETTTDTQENTSTSAPTIGTPSKRNSSVVLVAVYDLSPSGIYTVVGDYTNATIPEQVIIRANELVQQNTEEQGWLEDFDLYYMRVTSNENPENYLIAYADGSSVNGWTTTLLMLVGVGLLALLVFFIINIYFSKWALRPVELSIKQQQQFTADASHELKTPLTVIIANMAILKSKQDDTVASQMQWVESTNTEAERMQLLVNDMLALSKPETHKQQMMQERVDFSDVVETEVLQFESVAFELGVELDSEIEEGLCVEGDAERLGRMVATLVDNACKYASKPQDDEDDSDENPYVMVSLAKKPTSTRRLQTLELNVSNNGPVIPKDDLPHIFTRFYRADKARTSSKGGYGLGLAIGQEIADEHNGNITATSTQRDGTTFTVTLPLLDA